MVLSCGGSYIYYFQNYLAKYGYLKESDAQSGNLLSSDYVKEGVSQFQRMAGLPVTGTYAGFLL